MAVAFEREAFIRKLTEAGVAPAGAAALAELFDKFAASKAQIEALGADIGDLRRRLDTGLDDLGNALRSEHRALRTSMTKQSYFAYLENLQFNVVAGLLAALVLIGGLLLWKLL